MLLAATLAIACLVVGPASYNTGSDVWCNTGLYSRVEVFADYLPKAFGAELTLNEHGWKVVQNDEEGFATHLNRGGHLMTKFAAKGPKSEIRWIWDGRIVFKCTAEPKEEAVCGPFEDPVKRF